MQTILRHSFSKINLKNDVPLSISINRESYNNFLYGGKDVEYSIENALSKQFPVTDLDGNIRIEYVGCRIVNPDFTIEECKIKNLSYTVSLYITLREIFFENNTDNKGGKKVKYIEEKEIFLCDFPILSDHDSFIIDGIEKVLISQIHKTSGVFFAQKDKNKNGNYIYTASIVPYFGSRLEFEISNKTSLLFRIDKNKKNCLYLLLRAFDLDDVEIISNIYQKIQFEIDGQKVSFALKLNDYVGQVSSFNIRDEKGNILIKKGAIISRLAVRKLKDIAKLYCNLEDLEGQYLYDGISKKGVNLRAGECLDAKKIQIIAKSNCSNFSLVNSLLSSYDSCILKDINENFEKKYEDYFKEMYNCFRSQNYSSMDDIKVVAKDTFFSPSKYNLMKSGRYRMNKTLGLSIPDDCCVLTKEEIFATVKKLIEFKNGYYKPDDIDSLSYRRIRNAGELVYLKFLEAVEKMIKKTREILTGIDFTNCNILVSELFSCKIVNKQVRDFFLLSDLCQFMEQNNVLSSLTHIRKITALGEKGMSADAVVSGVRDIHVSHYGRICPIETPDGKNIGIVTNFACYAKLDEYGFIKTPYLKVIDGKLSDKIEYLDADEEKKYKICSMDDFTKSPEGSFVSVRYQEDFVLANKHDIQYVDVSTDQIVSICAAFIPFLESNDTARALMGCNMQKQAVPLLFKEIPFVATGFESKVLKSDTRFVLKANESGKVIFADSKNIVTYDEKNWNKVNFYKLNVFGKNNQNTFENQSVIVNIGDEVKKGQIIADCSSSCNGEVSLGKNILLAFMPWNGYNYEDSVVISKKIVNDDVFTSVHIYEYTTTVRDTSLGAEYTTRDLLNIDESKVKNLDETGVIMVGAKVKGGDILVGKCTPVAETVVSSEEKLLQAIFGDSSLKFKNTSLYLPLSVEGTVVDVKVLTSFGYEKDERAKQIERDDIVRIEKEFEYENNVLTETLSKSFLDNGVSSKKLTDFINKGDLSVLKNDNKEVLSIAKIYLEALKRIKNKKNNNIAKVLEGDKLPHGALKQIKVFVAVKSKLQPGDKIAGRHGNKGVISRCVPVEDMPYMEDGTPIDLLFSSVSVPGRMNIGQILETHLGLLSYNIGKKIDSFLSMKNASDNIKKILLDISTDAEFTKEISKMNNDQLIELGKEYRKGLYFKTPIFNGCKIEDIDRIASKLGIDKSLQMDLYDGLTGRKFDRKITVGYMYIIKLHHLVDEKIHARSTGTYSIVTQQPLGGRANFGGQRVGEMECWALQAYGAAYTLQEIMTFKSDDIKGRETVYQNILNGSSRFNSGIPESFNVLCREFRALGFDVEFGFNN